MLTGACSRGETVSLFETSDVKNPKISIFFPWVTNGFLYGLDVVWGHSGNLSGCFSAFRRHLDHKSALEILFAR